MRLLIPCAISAAFRGKRRAAALEAFGGREQLAAGWRGSGWALHVDIGEPHGVHETEMQSTRPATDVSTRELHLVHGAGGEHAPQAVAPPLPSTGSAEENDEDEML